MHRVACARPRRHDRKDDRPGAEEVGEAFGGQEAPAGILAGWQASRRGIARVARSAAIVVRRRPAKEAGSLDIHAGMGLGGELQADHGHDRKEGNRRDHGARQAAGMTGTTSQMGGQKIQGTAR